MTLTERLKFLRRWASGMTVYEPPVEHAREYKALAEMIRSGQVPHEDVPRILSRDPLFAEYYAKTIVSK